MKPPANRPPSRPDDLASRCSGAADAIEMLEAVAAVEGLPIEWMIDREKTDKERQP